MTQTISIAHNAVNAKLHEPSRELKLKVQSILSYAIDGAEHSMQFKRGYWDGRSSFLDFKTGVFPAGFVHFVSAHLRRDGYTVNLVKKPLPPALGPEKPVVDKFGDDPRYDYQMEVVNRLIKHGQIIAQVATGGGKSRIAKMAFARIGRPAMFLTTRGILMYQMHEAFERDLGTKVSVLGDGQFGHTIVDEHGRERQAIKKMSVAMVQTLVARLEEKTVEGEIERMANARVKREMKELTAIKKRLVKEGMTGKSLQQALDAADKCTEANRPRAKDVTAEAARRVHEHMAARTKTIDLLGKFELVILEEAHEASGNSYFEIMRHCKNAYYRLALTATPFMKDSEESNMRLMACSGPIAIKVPEKLLIDRGILARPYFKFIKSPNKPPKLFKHTGWQSAYRIGIVENEFRNRTAVYECRRFAQYGLTSMVLVQHTAHGDLLADMMKAEGLRVMFIQGEDDQDGRKAALAMLTRGELDVLVGTTILDVGVDVPAVGHICLLGGGKAEVALRQRIGRGLRAKKFGPNVCFVTDFHDEYNDHLKVHAKTRQAIIEGTPGFDENILPAGADFDLVGLGFKPLAIAA
jgi:superfamily II DNA or RNA helicase